MSNLRGEFEKLPEIKKKLKGCNWQYSEYLDCYLVEDISAGFINGAWFMFQKQQKDLLEKQQKIDTAQNLLYKLQYSSGERICKEVSEILQ